MSEHNFSKLFVSALRAKGIFVQRIESGTTGRGIPDIFAATRTKDAWIELKAHKRISINSKQWCIGWRPGQQAWSKNYLKVAGRHTYTAVAMKDGYIIIPMIKYYRKNIVLKKDVIVCKTSKELINEII